MVQDQTSFILAMVRHLPPSRANLKLIDVNGTASEVLAQHRGDLAFQSLEDQPLSFQSFSGNAAAWDAIADQSIDAVVGYAYIINEPFLAQVFRVLRPGGRLVVVDPRGTVQKTHGERLGQAGFVRILIEAAVLAPQASGVLIRGEKPHQSADTPSRIDEAARYDADHLSLKDFRGRYVHLLVQQTPNKPVWRLDPEEVIQWRVAALEGVEGPILLAFSSLPKAVAFMQPAVMQNIIQDVNKVGKFSLETAQSWPWPVMLNPTLESLGGQLVTYMPINPNTAEAPDE